jgi:hyaluronoglucosaminidase
MFLDYVTPYAAPARPEGITGIEGATGVKPSQRLLLFFILSIATLNLSAAAQTAPPECAVDAGEIVYPYPQRACLRSGIPLPAAIAVSIKSKAAGEIENNFISELLKSNGVRRSDGPAAQGAGSLILEEGGPKHKSSFRQEGYSIQIGGDPASIRIAARSSAGFYYALLTLSQLIHKSQSGPAVYKGEIEDFPRFMIRGVLEGGYSVWTHEERLSVLRSMGVLKMNSFMYAPKEGELFRRRWRVLYNKQQLDEFRQYIDICNKQHVEFVYALSPALSMEYSDPAEFGRLVAKFRQIQALGVKRFVIFFDDVLPVLSTPGDKRRYSHIAEAEVDVTNRLLKALRAHDRKAQLAFCPNQYWGWTPTRYFKILREQLDPEILIGWTGKEIVSEKVLSKDAKSFIKVVGRKPALGDNWSPFGPVIDRDPDLYNYTDSYLNNPCGFARPGEAQRSKFVDSTVGDYGWNPEGYNPRRSFTMAAKLIAGDKKLGDILLLALRLAGETHENRGIEISYISHLKEIAGQLSAAGSGASDPILTRFSNDLASYQTELAELMAGPMDPDMKKELKPFMDKASEKLAAAAAELKAFQPGGDTAALAQKIKSILGLKP